MIVLGRWGMTWLLVILGLAFFLPGKESVAGETGGLVFAASGPRQLALMAVSAQTPMEAQMLGEKLPTPSGRQTPGLVPGLPSLLEQRDEGITLRLPQNFRISFRYSHERAAGMAERLFQPPVLFKYSMEYRLLPNLQVGMSGFLYQPPQDQLTYLQQRRTILGWGPKLSYDLGRWTFAFQTQMERGLTDGTPGLQNWLRIWYAF